MIGIGKTRRTGTTAAVSLVLALAGLGLTAAPASAAAIPLPVENLAAEQAVLSQVLNSPDPDTAADALSGSDQALLTQATTHQNVTTLASSDGQLSAADIAAEVAAGNITPDVAAAAAKGGCWYHYQYDGWSDLGITEGYTWMQLNWCSNGPTITSWRTSNYGGQGVAPIGYSGVIGHWSGSVGWEVRSAVEFKFDAHFFPANPCMQIRGGHTGLYSTRRDCNLQLG